MSDNIIRKQHTGQSGNGGEFGNHNRPDSDVSLAERDADQVFTLRKASGNGTFSIDNDQTMPPAVKTDFGFSQTIRIGGTPHVNVRARAIREILDQGEATGLAGVYTDHGNKMTLLCVGTNGRATVREGTGVRLAQGPALMNKGSKTKGYYLHDMGISAVAKGYGKSEEMLAAYAAAAAEVPAVDEPTWENIPDTTDSVEEPPSDIAAVFLIDGPDFGDGSAPGCLFLATDVQAEDGIVNGYFWAPDDSGVYSEHGSMYFDDMKRRGSRVRHYRAGAMTFGDVMGGSLGTTRGNAYAEVREASN